MVQRTFCYILIILLALTPPLFSAAKKSKRGKLIRIARLEDQGFLSNSELLTYLKDSDEQVRHRAVITLGILQDSSATLALMPLLLKIPPQARKDWQAQIRQAAAFALGQIGDRKALPALVKALSDRDTGVRRHVIEALGKLGSPEAVLPLIVCLQDNNDSIRGEAALALARIKDPRTLPPLTTAVNDQNPVVRWKATYALFRQSDSATIPILHRKLFDSDSYVRSFAARGLGTLKASSAVQGLVSLLKDPDWKVQVNTIRALAQINEKSTSQLLLQLIDRINSPVPPESGEVSLNKNDHSPPNLYLLGEAITALGQLADSATYRHLVEFLSDPEIDIRARTAIALSKIDPHRAIFDLKPLVSDSSWYFRGQLAHALAKIKSPETYPLLESLLVDPDFRVRSNALASLLPSEGEATSAFPAEKLRHHIARALTDSDRAIVATACDLITRTRDSLFITDLVNAYRIHWHGSNIEAKLSIIACLANFVDSSRLPQRIATTFDLALSDSNRLVRREAITAFKKAGFDRSSLLGLYQNALNSDQYAAVYERYTAPQPGEPLQDETGTSNNPKALVDTEAGRIVIELLPQSAPRTVANFIQLVKKGFFDGLSFHRVVPNFVIQTGCPRGDGWGDPGYTIRCEYNDLHYERGMVGMALSGKDTGGSQWFITQSPQPHLDGRYTIFGKVISNMSVVDQIMIGDKIVKIQIAENGR